MEEEAQQLQTLINDPQTPERLVVRARIILTAWVHPEDSNQHIATTVGTSANTVRTWRKRWAKFHRLSDFSRHAHEKIPEQGNGEPERSSRCCA